MLIIITCDFTLRCKKRNTVKSHVLRTTRPSLTLTRCFLAEGKTLLQSEWDRKVTVDLVRSFGSIEQLDYAPVTKLHVEIVQSAEQLKGVPCLHRGGKMQDTCELVVRPNYLIDYPVGFDSVSILRILNARQTYL